MVNELGKSDGGDGGFSCGEGLGFGGGGGGGGGGGRADKGVLSRFKPY